MYIKISIYMQESFTRIESMQICIQFETLYDKYDNKIGSHSQCRLLHYCAWQSSPNFSRERKRYGYLLDYCYRQVSFILVVWGILDLILVRAIIVVVGGQQHIFKKKQLLIQQF